MAQTNKFGPPRKRGFFILYTTISMSIETQTHGTKEGKYVFSAVGEPLGGADGLVRATIGHINGTPVDMSFPDGHGGYVHTENMFAVVRHPDRIPAAIDGRAVEFGGPQSVAHIEASMARKRGVEAASVAASTVIEAIHQRGLKEASKISGGVFGVGTEAEMWTYDATGCQQTLPIELQEELHANLWETATPIPTVDPKEQAVSMAQDVVDRKALQPQLLINGTSMPVTGRASEMILNQNDGPLGKYVMAMQTDLYNRMFYPKDRVARMLWDKVAQNEGYADFDTMKEAVGTIAPWAMAAGHASIGLAHEQKEDGTQIIGLEDAVAVGDSFNSNLGSVAEWMMYSSPVVFGEIPQVGDMTPRDGRAALRYAMLTTYPADSVGSTDGMEERAKDAMVRGVSDRLDRASFIANLRHNGQRHEVPSAHGRVRNRITYPNMHQPFDTTGRVEFTGSGASPDITAQVGRNAFLQLMAVHAYEAVANGQHPAAYSGDEFPALATNHDQRYLAHRYNFNGADDEKTADVIGQAHRFVDRMQKTYDDDETITSLCEYARFGLEKLTYKTNARTLDQFADTGYRGAISDVIRHMHEDGATPEEIVVAIDAFQVRQAQEILAQNAA